MGGMGGMGHEVEIGHEVKIGHSYHSYLPTLVYMTYLSYFTTYQLIFVLWNIPGGAALSKTISSCVDYVTLQKYFSHPSLVIKFVPTLPSKLVHWDCKRVGDYNSNPPGPIKLSSQSTAL